MKIKENITIQNYICRFMYLGVTFLAVPISLKYLGEERYGIWQTILTIIGFVSLTNFGVGNGLRNKVTEYYTKNEKKKLKKVISSAYISITVISIILMILLIPVIINVEYSKIYGNISINNIEIKIAFIITIIGFLINFVLGLVNSISFGIHKSNLVSFSQVFAAIISLILTMVIAKQESNLCYIALIYMISNTIVNILIGIVIFKKGNEFIPSIKYFDKKECNVLYTLGVGFFVLQIASLLMNTSDNFIVAKLVGVGEVTNYSIVNKLFNLIPTLFAILLIQLWSKTAENKVNKNYTEIRASIKKLFKIIVLIVVGVIGLINSFDLITKIWLKTTLEVDKILIISAGGYAILVCINGIFVNIQNGLGKIKYQIISYSIAAIVQIPLAFILVEKMGLGASGVMLGKCIIMVVPAIMNGIFVMQYLKKKNKENLEEIKNDCSNQLC